MTMAYIVSVLHQDLVDGVGSDHGGADGAQAEGLVDLVADRVVDPADDLGDVEHVLRHLRRHDVAVVAVGQRAEGVGFLDAGPFQHVLVDAVADQRRAWKVLAQAGECAAALVDDGHIVVLLDQLKGQPGAHPATAHDDDLHEDWIMAESISPVGFVRACASRFGSWGCCRCSCRSGSALTYTSTRSATASHLPSSSFRRRPWP